MELGLWRGASYTTRRIVAALSSATVAFDVGPSFLAHRLTAKITGRPHMMLAGFSQHPQQRLVIVSIVNCDTFDRAVRMTLWGVEDD
jgi:hypothetical protein